MRWLAIIALLLILAGAGFTCEAPFWGYVVPDEADPLFPVETSAGTKFIDRNGKVVVQPLPTFDYFHQGRIRLFGGKVVDATGKMVEQIPRDSWMYREGLVARKGPNGKVGFVDA